MVNIGLTYYAHCVRRITYLLEHGHKLKDFVHNGIDIHKVQVTDGVILVNDKASNDENLLCRLIKRMEEKDNEIDYKQTA